MVPIYTVMLRALELGAGARYVFGAENDATVAKARTNAITVAFAKLLGALGQTDCSELVQNACTLAGLTPPMPDGSWYQLQHCVRHGTRIPVEDGKGSYGRLLFAFDGDPYGQARPRSAHVAFSLGNGTTYEARGTRHHVGVHPVEKRTWTHAAELPGADYTGFPRRRLAA